MRRFPELEFPVTNGRAIYEQYRELSNLALRMQTRGLRIDQGAVEQHIKDATARKADFAKKFTSTTGITELGDDGQSNAIRAWFWDTKGAPKITAPKQKNPGLDTKAALLWYLTEWDDPIIKEASASLIGYRKASKALGILAAYRGYATVHPSWNVTGTKGARWSCSGPNIQQLPAKNVKYNGELLAANLKNIIIPYPGYIFVGSDYSALEVYLQAYLSGDKRTLEWISRGEDLHINNARIFFGEEAVPATADKKSHKLERDVGKLGFGFSYNVTEHIKTTHKQMRSFIPAIDEDWTREARRRYFEAHPELPQWQRDGMAKIQRDGWDEFGLMRRRLYLEASTRGYNQRQNTTCQTLGGDLVNTAMLSIDKNPEFSRDSFISITWHDSIIAEVPEDNERVKAVGALIRAAMAGPFPINGYNATFVAEPDVGPNLRDMVALSC